MDTDWKSRNIDLTASNLCRLCAKTNDCLSPIFNSAAGLKELVLLINKYLPKLQVQCDDSKPQGVCESCISKLHICEQLIETSMVADTTFDEILRSQPSVQEDITSSGESLHKENGNTCFWVDSSSKNKGETVDVPAEGSVIVVSKLAKQSHTQPEQDFVVMLQVEYKEDQLDSHSFIPDSLEKTLTNNTSHEKRTLNQLFEPCSEKYFLLETPFTDGKYDCESYPLREKSNSKMVCKLCGAKFSRMTRLKAHHTALHTDSRPHKCDQCDATFAMRWDLTLHQRLHARTFQCDFCDKIFTARSKLDRHRRTHTGERPFECPHCEKAFAEKRNLENHIRTHTGERPYQCEVCFKNFRVRSHLTEHQRIHSQIINFTCKFCDKSFKWKANYSLHMKTHTHNKHDNQ